MTTQKNTLDTKTLAIGAVLTAIVIVLQYLGSFIHIGPFSISLVLVPLVIGASISGKGISSWLGLVFGVIVLVSGDAAAFLAINVPATILIVLLKGIAAGFVAGLVYELLVKVNRYLAVLAAAIICPIVNTGIFLLGSRLFFFDTIKQWAGQTNAIEYMFVGLVGLNFIVELAVNVVLSPTIVTIIKVYQKN